MPNRRYAIDAAERRARAQVRTVIEEGRTARLARGISMSSVASVIGCSRQLIGALEHERLRSVDPILLAAYGAAVGLDVSLRTHAGGSPLRDGGQLRLLERFRDELAGRWHWRTEVSVAADERDRRAIDAVLDRGWRRVGIEAITRLMDAQRETRSIGLKQTASGLPCVVLVLADTRHNRTALEQASATIDPAFPLRTRAVMRSLRNGDQPRENGIVLI